MTNLINFLISFVVFFILIVLFRFLFLEVFKQEPKTYTPKTEKEIEFNKDLKEFSRTLKNSPLRSLR